MKTYIIRDKNQIIDMTGNDNIEVMLLRIDNLNKKASYLSDYTWFELIINLDYKQIIKKTEVL